MASQSFPITAVEAWTDSTGKIHLVKDDALLVEVERALGKLGNGANEMLPGIARRIVENRDALIPLLEAFGPLVRVADESAEAKDGPQ